ncbi:MAG: hypothetical protein WBA16_04895 [Nonlabens sp.]
MITFYLPRQIKSDQSGYESLLQMHSRMEHLRRQTVALSFRNVTWIEANLTAVIGAMIEYLQSNENKVLFIETDNFHRKNDILSRNGFFGYYGVQLTSWKPYDTQLDYKKFAEDQSTEYNEYIQNELIDNPEFPKHSVKLGNKIKENIYELFENARTHGRCSNIHTCGQFYPAKKKLHITIVDTGTTIVKNVRDYLKKGTMPSHDCINWAMQTGHTTKNENIPGGLGLGLICEFIGLNNGKMQIVSSNGFWELRKGKLNTTTLNFTFLGTIANLEFNLSDNTTYFLKEENINPNDIF